MTGERAAIETEIIHRFIQAYNAFDVAGMLTLLSPDVRFENYSSDALTASASGVDEFRQLAEQSVSMFSMREQRIVSEETSAILTAMMERTVSEGTARKAFHVRRGRSAIGPIRVAGKTGSLSDHPPLPFKDYSWFVGFAPAEEPTIAVAAVVVNGLRWKVKAPFLAREAMRVFFENDGGTRRHASR